jgi:PRC-barrel domain protein
MMTELNGRTDTLRYLDAGQVEHPSGTFAGHMLCSQDDEKLGAITGMLVEPSTRRVRYFVIERSSLLRQRRYLLPADSLPVLHADDRTLCVLAKADDLERFDARQIERFSDEDAITAIFARPAA